MDLIQIILVIVAFCVAFWLITQVIHWPAWLPVWVLIVIWGVVLIFWLLWLAGISPNLGSLRVGK
jgi:hypothetical protein